MTIEQAKKLEHFLCTECSSDDDAKRSLNNFTVSPHSEPKVRVRRLFVSFYCFFSPQFKLVYLCCLWLCKTAFGYMGYYLYVCVGGLQPKGYAVCYLSNNPHEHFEI